MSKWLVCLVLAGLACTKKVDEQEPKDNPRLSDLRNRYAAYRLEAKTLADPKTGWVMGESGDAIRFDGPAAKATGAKIVAAEYAEASGRFCRYPGPKCPALYDAPTSWSRDAGLGLLWAMWNAKDKATLARHADYGTGHLWKMGEPLDDGRVLYTPNMIGLLYQTIYALGGKDNANRHWPSSYPAGARDFEAALQTLSILLRGEVSETLGDPLPLPRASILGLIPPATGAAHEADLILDISAQMFDRLNEHHIREPGCPLYQAAWGRYSGDLGPAVDACLAEASACEYLRCKDFRRCYLADWLFACGLVLADFGQEI